MEAGRTAIRRMEGWDRFDGINTRLGAPIPDEVPIQLGRSAGRRAAGSAPAAPTTLGLFDGAEAELPAVTAQRER